MTIGHVSDVGLLASAGDILFVTLMLYLVSCALPSQIRATNIYSVHRICFGIKVFFSVVSVSFLMMLITARQVRLIFKAVLFTFVCKTGDILTDCNIAFKGTIIFVLLVNYFALARMEDVLSNLFCGYRKKVPKPCNTPRPRHYLIRRLA